MDTPIYSSPTRHVLKEKNTLVSSPNRSKNNSSIDSSQISSENNLLIVKNSDENFLDKNVDVSLLAGFNNLNIATPKSKKNSLLLEPNSNTCPSSDDESFAECNSFNVTQNDEEDYYPTKADVATVLNDVLDSLNKTDYDPLDEIECFSIDRNLLVKDPVNTTCFEDYSYISSTGLPGNSNVNETLNESFDTTVSLNTENSLNTTVIEPIEEILENKQKSVEVDSLKDLAVKSLNNKQDSKNPEITNLIASDSGISDNFASEAVAEPMDVDESIYELPIDENQENLNQIEVQLTEQLNNQTFDETEKVSEISDSNQTIKELVSVPETEKIPEISDLSNQTVCQPELITEEARNALEKEGETLAINEPESVPISETFNQTFDEIEKLSEIKQINNEPESVSISETLNETFDELVKIPETSISKNFNQTFDEPEKIPKITESSNQTPISETFNQTFDEPEKLPEINQINNEPESVPISETLNTTFDEPEKIPEIIDSSNQTSISETFNQTFDEPEKIPKITESSNQTSISESVPITENLNQTFDEPEKLPEISDSSNQIVPISEPEKIIEIPATAQQLNQTFEEPMVQGEIMPEQINETNERRLSIRSDLYETPQSTPIKERSQSSLSQNNNSEIFVEQKLQENLDVTFKTPAIPGGSGFFNNTRKSGGVVVEDEDEVFQDSSKFTFQDSDFDFLANKCSSNTSTEPRSSVLLRFDPFLGTPVPVIGSGQAKLSATIEEDTNSNSFGAGAVVEQIGDSAMNGDMKIENLSSLDEKLDYKMDLEKKVKNEHLKTEDIEKKLKDAEAREEILLRRITEKDKAMTRMCGVVEEYEKAIAELIAEKEQIQQEFDRKCEQLKKDADTNGLHLGSLEDTFSDLHAKYEKSKQLTLSLKEREDILTMEKRKAHDSLIQQEQRYDQMKNHAISQLENANIKLASYERNHTVEMTKLKANLKKAELASQSTLEQLQQKTRENEELVKICDELIGTPS